MKLISKIFANILFIPLLIVWLLFCLLIALLGSLFINKKIQIDLQRVIKRDTICSVLYEKNLLNKAQYEFETAEVASWYDELTFNGYLFILNPVIKTIKYFSFFDDIIYYLVKKWIEVHYYQKEYKSKPKTFFSFLTTLSVKLANWLGQILYRIK